MALNVLQGGLSTLLYLGCVDSNGAVHRRHKREWATEDNGNPTNIIDIARQVVSPHVLFTVERDFNQNVCCYVLGDNGVAPKWLMIPDETDVENAEVEDLLADGMHTEELTYLETRAYGVDGDASSFILRAIKGETFTLTKDPAGITRACVTLNGYQWFVNRILLHTKSNIVGFPSVYEVHITVQDRSGKTTQFFYAMA